MGTSLDSSPNIRLQKTSEDSHLEKNFDHSLAQLKLPPVPESYNLEVSSSSTNPANARELSRKSKSTPSQTKEASIATKKQEPEAYLEELGSVADTTAGGQVGLVTSSGLYGKEKAQGDIAEFLCANVGEKKQDCLQAMVQAQQNDGNPAAISYHPINHILPQQCAIDMKDHPLSQPDRGTPEYYRQSVYVPAHEGSHCNPINQHLSDAERSSLNPEWVGILAETHAAFSGFLAVAIDGQRHGDQAAARKYLKSEVNSPDTDRLHRFTNEAAQAVLELPEQKIKELASKPQAEINRESFNMSRIFFFGSKAQLR